MLVQGCLPTEMRSELSMRIPPAVYPTIGPFTRHINACTYKLEYTFTTQVVKHLGGGIEHFEFILSQVLTIFFLRRTQFILEKL